MPPSPFHVNFAKAAPALCRAVVAAAMAFLCLPSAFSQRPGTTPPAQIFSGSGEDSEELPVKAFMFMSEAQSTVVVPRMTWEELQRLMDSEAQSELYSYQELRITGQAVDHRAEMEVTLELLIEPTGNKLIPIPLRMGNFHRLAPPDVTGVDDYFMTLSPEGGGYMLWVRSQNRHTATIRMDVSARVESTSTRSLDFQLPDVPSTVKIVAQNPNVTGDVIGQGYETIETKPTAGGGSEFTVESGGGRFTLRWGRLEQQREDTPLLEVTSRVNVSWDSPQDPPRASVQLTVQNVSNSIETLELRLPRGAELSNSASLGTAGQSIKFDPPSADELGDRRTLMIPENERQKRIDLNFSYSLPVNGGAVSATNPLAFQVPQVVGALRHRGELTLQTNQDYQLRWKTEPWVRSVIGEGTEDSTLGRTYTFEYDRSSFALPLWLAAKERQVRVTAEMQVTFREMTAALDMVIRSSGRAADGRGPQVDLAGWQLQSIENDETGEVVDSFEGDGFPEIDFPPGAGAPPPIRLRAEKTFDTTTKSVAIELPRIVKTDTGLLVPTSQVEVVNQGRYFLVVNLDDSRNLERIATGDANLDDTASVYRIESHQSNAVLAGRIVEQPQRITLASDGTIALDGNQLKTTVDWTVTSRLDLEGRLPIRFPIVNDNLALQTNGTLPPLEPDTALANPPAPSVIESAREWTVTVAGVPAALTPVGEDRFELVSDRLAEGTVAIRWYRTTSIRPATVGDSFESIALPRPAIDDVTVRGAVRIALVGSPETELISSEAAAGELRLDALPPDPIRLRMRSRNTAREELSISQAVLRTAVGLNTRHEQLLLKIRGGDDLRIGLPSGLGNVAVEAYVDSNAVTVRRESDTMLLSLPGDQVTHVVDLRVWMPESASGTTKNIRPMLRLPIGVGRVYWQIVTPRDSHLLWASPTMGRSMSWSFAPWKLGRQSTHDDRALTAMVGSQPHPMPPGNDYLYIGSDVRSFEVISVSRVALWLAVGVVVLLTSVVLTYIPQSRHPLSAVFASVVFAGLLTIAPDAAVLLGQLAVIALVLVIVMIAVRALVAPSRSDRLLPSRDLKRRTDASTQSLPVPPNQERRSSISQTRSLPPQAEAQS